MSGSDAALNSLTVSNGITGSLFGTASYATTAGNGGVTKILAGSNVNISPVNGLGDVTVTSFGTNLYNTATGSYGSFYDTGSVLASSATTIYSMSLSTTDISNGVYVSASNGDRTRIKFTNAGTYNVQFSAQFSNTDNSTQDVVVWARKNGVNIDDSSGTVGVPPFKAGSNGQTLSSWNYYFNLSANDYIQLCWHPEQANVITLETIAAGTSPVHPRTPSLILTAQRVDTFLSNTGSFTGTFTGQFTGSLQGTSSYAVTASYVNPLQQAVIITGSLQISSSAGSLNNIGGTTYLGSILGIGAASDASYYPNDRHFIRATVRTDVPYTYGFLQSYSVPGGGFQPLRIEGLPIIFSTNTTSYFDTDGNLGISNISWLGGTPASSSYPILPSKLYVKGNTSSSLSSSLLIQNSSLSSSLIVLDNGNVGIGTITPSASLQINTPTGSIQGLIVKGAVSQSANLAEYQNSIGTVLTRIDNVGSVISTNGFYASSNSGLFNISTGNNASVYVNTAGTKITRNIADSSPALIVQNAHASSSGDILQLQNNVGTQVVVNQSGSVGIGTASPAYKLDVSGSGRFTNGLTVTGSMAFTGDITGSNAIFTGTITAQKLVVQTVTSSVLYSSGSNIFGNDINNTQTFTGSLQITGSVRSTGNIITSGSLNILATGGQTLYFTNTGQLGSSGTGVHITMAPGSNTTTLSQVVTTNNGLNVTPGGNATTYGLIVTSGSYPAATLLRVGVNSLVVTGSNVGIGTTTPTRPLHIKNTATNDASKAYILIDADGTVDGAATLTFSQNNLNWQSVLSTHTSAGGVNFGLQLNDGGTATFVTNKGKMFVGNTFTIPSASLHAKGSGITSASIALLVENSSRSTLLSVVDNGFVGIGITAPSYSLDVSGSGRFTNSIIVTGSLQISASIFQYSNNASITSASIGNIASFPTSSYQAGFFDYVASSGTNARAGTIFTVWNGTSIEYSETATNDIGLTNNLILSASLSGANILLQGRSLSGSWSVKTLTRMI